GVGIAGSDFDRAIIEKRLLNHFGLEQSGLPPEIAELIRAVADWSALPDWSTPQIQGSLDRLIQSGAAPVRFQALKALVFNNLAFSFYDAVESGKIALSSPGVTAIRLQAKNLDLWELYTRSQFEKDIAEHRAQIEAVLQQAVAASGLAPEQIEIVVKTGGSSYIPLFAGMLEGMFGREKIKSANAFSSVTAGLAVRAWEEL
ncbi:MAG: Hsp70 family protein, partial [Chloroflexi bacterium]|nr:Hsp70 family protein [Chloroflexota bacterium]